MGRDSEKTSNLTQWYKVAKVHLNYLTKDNLMFGLPNANVLTYVVKLSILSNEVIDFVQKVAYVPSWIDRRIPFVTH